MLERRSRVSRELRLVLILFGSVGALFVFAVIAAFFVWRAQPHHYVQRNSAGEAQIAAKISGVPDGYRIRNAAETFVSRTVSLVAPQRGMSIALSVSLLAPPVQNGSSDEAQQITLKTMRFAMSLTCSGLHDLPSETFPTKSGRVRLSEFECLERSGHGMRMALGQFQSRSGSTQIVASGLPAPEWDAAGLRQLFASI